MIRMLETIQKPNIVHFIIRVSLNRDGGMIYRNDNRGMIYYSLEYCVVLTTSKEEYNKTIENSQEKK